MTLLTMVQEFCARRALPIPATCWGNPDPSARQYIGLMNELLEELYDRGQWSFLTAEATWTSLADTDQGPLDTLAPFGFLDILKDTIWDRTQRMPFYGPLSSQETQLQAGIAGPGVMNQFRLWMGHLFITPTPAAGHTMAFEYRSSWGVIAGGGTHILAESTAHITTEVGERILIESGDTNLITSDGDTFVFPDNVMLSGLRYKYKQEKGLDYAEEFRLFEQAVVNCRARDNAQGKTLHMDEGREELRPGIFVPAGSWQIP